MRKRFLILILFLYPLTPPLQAQEFFKFNSSGGGFNLFVGLQGFNASPYFSSDTSIGLSRAVGRNPVLKGRDSALFSIPTGNLTTIGFQGYGLFNSIILGGEVSLGFGRTATGNQYQIVDSSKVQSQIGSTSTFAFSSNMLLNLGLVAYRKRGLIIYPLAGIGWGLSGIRMQSEREPRIYPEITGVETTNNPQNMLVWTNNMVLDFSLGTEYFIGRTTEDNAKGFSIGFRVGYNMQLPTNMIKVNYLKNASDNPRWVDREPKPVLPSVGASGVYAKLLIGFGRVGENL
jgi:hypothetical protein